MLQRLLPALLPGWRFFDEIGPSPRVDYALLPAGTGPASAQWRAFRPTPQRLPPHAWLTRLVWNPDWNETLFVLRCAERVLEGDTAFALAELRDRVDAAARAGLLYGPGTPPPAALSLRVRAVTADGAGCNDSVVFIAQAWPAPPVTPP
mgnify:CR=1 FL=1